MIFQIRALKIFLLVSIIILGAASVSAAQSNQSGITSQQREQLKDLAEETKRNTQHERNSLKKARMELYQAYKNYNIDNKTAKAALAKINSAQLNLLNLHLQNQIQLRNILNKNQFNQLKKQLLKSRERGNDFIPSRAELFQEMLPSQKMLEDADLSQEQLNKASIIFKQKQKEKAAIEKLRMDSLKIMRLYSNYDLDTQAAKNLIRSIHASQSELANLSHRKQLAFRNILTESQFIQVRNQVIKQLNKKNPNRDSKRK